MLTRLTGAMLQVALTLLLLFQQTYAVAADEQNGLPEIPSEIFPAKEPDDSSNQEHNNSMDLALKEITLRQGEGGLELWRLKARWANIQKHDDLILVDKPRLTYFMNENDKTMYVESEKGEVEQKKQIIRFITTVRVTQDDKRIFGELLVYNGADKTMTFPDGGQFSSATMHGKGDSLIWHIDNRVIDVRGNITVHLFSSAANTKSSVIQPLDEINETTLLETAVPN